MMALFGAILPRFALLVAWSNNQAFWNGLFGPQIWLVGGFLILPWSTLLYGFMSANGMSVLNWIFLGLAVMADLGTWGVGFFATRQQVSSYRDA